MKEQYVTLLSNSDLVEFPTNSSSSFKNRLPYPLRFNENGWKVGLVKVSTPAVNIPLKLTDTIICHFRWTLSEDHTRAMYADESLIITPNDLQVNHFQLTDGQALMQFIQNQFRVKLAELVVHGMRVKDHQNNKKYYPTFRWEGEEFLIDNTDTYTSKDLLRSPPMILFGKQLALDMEWIHYNETSNSYLMGPNLTKELTTDVVPNNVNDLYSNPLNADDPFYLVNNDGLKLSVFCNWRFVNLNKAYENAFGSPHRSLYIYCNVGESRVVGNQITDLLREIPYNVKSRYFEPRHILYQPVRGNVLDILEVNVSENNGKLVKFLPGVTSVTLHFKHESRLLPNTSEQQ